MYLLATLGIIILDHLPRARRPNMRINRFTSYVSIHRMWKINHSSLRRHPGLSLPCLLRSRRRGISLIPGNSNRSYSLPRYPNSPVAVAHSAALSVLLQYWTVLSPSGVTSAHKILVTGLWSVLISLPMRPLPAIRPINHPWLVWDLRQYFHPSWYQQVVLTFWRGNPVEADSINIQRHLIRERWNSRQGCRFYPERSLFMGLRFFFL